MTNRSIENLLRECAPQVLSTMLAKHHNFADAEDAVQEAMLNAHLQWARHGIPRKPVGWLVTVARRRLIDQMRSEKSRSQRELEDVASNRIEDAPVPAADETLYLFFLCCDSVLSRQASIALTLRAVGGLTTREIAAAFMIKESTMAQRISLGGLLVRDHTVNLFRSKNKIAKAGTNNK